MALRHLQGILILAALAALPHPALATDTWTNLAPGVYHLFRTTGEPN